MINKTIGCRINQLLAEKDVKQKDLAKELGVTDNTVSYFVSGARKPNIEQIIKIAKYFNVSTDYILGVSNAKTTNAALKGVCEYTGLSEANIRRLNSYSEKEIYVLNMFLSSIIPCIHLEPFYSIAYFKQLYNKIQKDIVEDFCKKNNLGTAEKINLLNISLSTTKSNSESDYINKYILELSQYHKGLETLFFRIKYNEYRIHREFNNLQENFLEDLISDKTLFSEDVLKSIDNITLKDIERENYFYPRFDDFNVEKEGESHGNNPEERK